MIYFILFLVSFLFIDWQIVSRRFTNKKFNNLKIINKPFFNGDDILYSKGGIDQDRENFP